MVSWQKKAVQNSYHQNPRIKIFWCIRCLGISFSIVWLHLFISTNRSCRMNINYVSLSWPLPYEWINIIFLSLIINQCVILLHHVQFIIITTYEQIPGSGVQNCGGSIKFQQLCHCRVYAREANWFVYFVWTVCDVWRVWWHMTYDDVTWRVSLSTSVEL